MNYDNDQRDARTANDDHPYATRETRTNDPRQTRSNDGRPGVTTGRDGYDIRETRSDDGRPGGM